MVRYDGAGPRFEACFLLSDLAFISCKLEVSLNECLQCAGACYEEDAACSERGSHAQHG